MSSRGGFGLTFGAALIGSCLATDAMAVTKQATTVNGLAVFKYTWADSKGLTRTVSLKREGQGNPGHGGYAIQMTYQFVSDGATVTRTANAPSGDGFGYFVAHERYRRFTDGASSPIAQKIFGKDDSPLGRGFAVTTADVATGAAKKSIQFGLKYPKYGTIAAGGINPDTGEDSPRVGTNPALFKLYQLAVSIRWHFEDGRDYPRIRTRVDMSDAPGPDRVSFDVRGPYGKLDFDQSAKPVRRVIWADRYYFSTSTNLVTRNASWTWSTANAGARHTALIIGTNEMGLLEPRPFARSATNDGYSDGRGQTSATYFGGGGCPFQDQQIPCDYEWPYQSSQYELPYDNPNGTTTSEKIAWGSTPYYGMSLASTYDGTQSVPFIGFPASKAFAYDICVVLGQTAGVGLTRTVGRDAPNYNCASAN